MSLGGFFKQHPIIESIFVQKYRMRTYFILPTFIFSLVNVKEPLMVNEVPELLEKETPVRLVMPQNVYVKRLMIHK